MLRRSWFVLPSTVVAVALALAGLGFFSGPSPAQADGAEIASGHRRSPSNVTSCPVASATVRPFGSEAAGSSGIVAVRRNRLVAVGAGGTARLAGLPAHTGMLRHVTASRFGVAYVEDRFGPDVVVIVTDHGTVRLPQRAEAVNPAWSPRGDLAWSVGTGLRIRSRAGTVTAVPGPVQGGTVFSPVFESPDRIVAAVSMPPTLAVPEDERLNNLWSYDRVSERWRAATHFSAGVDRWTAVRTPVARPGGVVEFVRITGRGTATHLPSFQLWRLTASGAVARLRTLAGERYLAGIEGGRRVWQVPDVRSGAFHLVAEGPGGERQLGCGTTSADPLDTADPDRRSRRGRFAPPRGHWPSLEEHAGSAAEQIPEVGLLLGDFAERKEAEEAAAKMLQTYGANAPIQVVDSSTAPEAILPGVYGALMILSSDADVMAALTDLRQRLPEYRDESWVVTP